MDKEEITVDLVVCLIREQFPQWAGLEIRPVELDGSDNSTFRLGDEMSVRVPSDERYVPQLEKERRWLPFLGRHLPLPIPRPLAEGLPGCGFPRPWSVYGWVDGDPAAVVEIRDLDRLAEDLAGFLSALHRVPTEGGPVAGPHSFDRGGPVSVWDEATRDAIDRLDGRIDTSGAVEVWDDALASPWSAPEVWVHGDMTASNFLVRNDRLCGVIDFGCCAIGDPACDLTAAWTLFDGSSRERFVEIVEVDPATWTRAKGWALWKAVVALPTLPEDHPRNTGELFGWRWSASKVIEQILN